MNAAKTSEELKHIKSNLTIDLKSLLCSSKDGLSERELKFEYRNYTGHDIPFYTLGYHSLYELMRDMPDAFEIRKHRVSSTWIYYVKHDERTSDLARLIRGQRDDKKGVREMRRARERNTYQQQQSPHYRYQQQQQQQQHQQQQQVCANIAYLIQNQIVGVFEQQLAVESASSSSSSSPSFASHLTLDGRRFEQLYVARYGVMFSHQAYGFRSARELLDSLKHLLVVKASVASANEYTVMLITSTLSPEEAAAATVGGQSNQSDRVGVRRLFTLEDEVVANLRRLILACGKEGVQLSSILRMYKEMCKRTLDFEILGYRSLDELIGAKLDSCAHIMLCDGHSDYMVFERNDESFVLDTENDNSGSSSQPKQPVAAEAKMNELIRQVANTFRNYGEDKPMSLEKFYAMFEKRNQGMQLNPAAYGFKTPDQLFMSLVERDIIYYSFDHNHQPHIHKTASSSSAAERAAAADELNASRDRSIPIVERSSSSSVSKQRHQHRHSSSGNNNAMLNESNDMKPVNVGAPTPTLNNK